MLRQTSPQGPTHAGRLQSNCQEAANKVYGQGTAEAALGSSKERLDPIPHVWKAPGISRREMAQTLQGPAWQGQRQP